MENFNTWRLILDGPADAFTNMATDVALVECVTRPVLRLYAWHPWAISLGFHQSLKAIDLQRCRQEGIDVLRRPTGGRAVLHAEEITYSVVVPSDHPWYQIGVQEVYRQISTALISGLRAFGAPAEVVVHQKKGDKAYFTETACFAKSIRFEVGIHGKKVVGSAQRRFPKGILQHGSILLGTAHERLSRFLSGTSTPAPRGKPIPHAMALSETLGYVPEFAEIAPLLAEGFQKTFDLTWQKSTLTCAEQTIMMKLRDGFFREIQYGDRVAIQSPPEI